MQNRTGEELFLDSDKKYFFKSGNKNERAKARTLFVELVVADQNQTVSWNPTLRKSGKG
jgi:hypothetical protein